jgi:hypothetical protein
MIGALITAFIAGVVARILTPGDIFRHMSVQSHGVSRCSSASEAPPSAT